MEQKQRFSLRKYKLGLASVLLGTIFLGGAVTSEAAYAATDSTEDTTQVDANKEEQQSTGKSEETEATSADEPSTTDTKDESTVSNEVTVHDRAASTETSGATVSTEAAATTPDKTVETKNLDNQTPQGKDKLGVESSETLEKDKNYYEAKDFDGNKVVERNDVTTTRDKNIDLTSDLDKVKSLDSATIYLEFKPKEGQSGTYSLFSASSSTNRQSYYTVGVLNGSSIFIGAPNKGSQLYGAQFSGGSIDENGWNSIAVSINRTNSAGAGRIDVYINGKATLVFSTRAGKFLKDYTDLTNMQLGLMNNGGNNIWGGAIDFRNFTIYNKALTATEVAERSAIFQRDAVSEAVDKDGRVLTTAEKVFTKDQLSRGTFRIPALVKMDNGTLVAGADQRNTGQADYGDIEMVVRTSNDNGKTWGDKVTIFNPQNNPKLGDTNSSNPATIDIALTAKGDKLYAMYDLFPEGRGLSSLPSKAVAAYKEIDGKKYQIVTKNGEEYTIRDNGKIFDASGKETAYSVVVDAKDKEHAYQDYGDVYEGNQKIGNILFKTGNQNGFQAVYTSYLMLSESSDNGKTWSAPKNISNMVRSDSMIFQGTGPGAGISLKHGKYAGRIIFPVYTTVEKVGERASVVYSDDNGVTWHSSSNIAPNMSNSETTIVELQNGTLKAFMRGSTFVQEATSTDGGATWTGAKNTDRYSNRTQIAATTTIQDGKEYVVLSTPGKTRRVDGIISIGEVQADNSIKWIKERKIVNGIYGYSSVADLGNGEFGILYEHNGRSADYPEGIYYKQANWKFLTEDAEPITIEATKSSLTNQDDVIALSYDEGVVASGNLVLTLSNGHTIEALGQRDANTVLFKWNKDSDQGAVITGVKSGSLDTLDSRNKIDVTASLPYTLTPKESSQVLSFDTYYKGDENLDYGSQKVEDGKVGQKVTRTTYTIDNNGKVIETTVTTTTDPIAKVIIKGTKPTTSTKDTDLGVRYEGDASLVYGEKTEVPGRPKVDTTTTTYEVDATTGKITPTTTTATTDQGLAKVVKIGIHPTTATTEVAYTTTYEADADLAFGTSNEKEAGVKGEDTTTTTYKLEGNHAVVDQVTTARTKNPVAQVIAVGTKPTITTEEVAFGTDYEADENLAYGETAEVAGKVGTKTITTTYKLDGSKAVADKTSSSITVQPVNKIIKVGTKPTVVTEDLPFGTDYVADENLAYGETAEVAGKVGTKTITTTYKLDGSKAVADKTSSSITVQPVNKIVKVGTKASTSTKDIAYTTTYEADASRDLNTTAVKTVGKKGIETTTTTYKLDGTKAVVDQVTTAVTKQPVVEVVQVGTKPTITTEEVAFGTDYEADENLAYGETAEVAGNVGTKTITTTYKLDGSKAVADKTSSSITVQPVNKIIKVGIKETVTTEEVPFGTDYVADENLAYGEIAEVAGKVGTKTITTTYKLDGSKAVADKISSAITVQPVNKIVKVGTKPTVVTAEVAYTTSYVGDASLEYGKTAVRTAGVKGTTTTTTTYKLEGDKAVVDKVTTVPTTEPTAEVIAVGNVQTATQPIAIVTRQVNDANLDAGQTRVVEEGKAGVSTTVTTYTVNPTTGALGNGQVQTTETVKMVERLVAIGTKVAPAQTTRRVEVRTEVLPFTTERRENAELTKGEEREVQSGVNGSYKVVRDDVYEGDKLVKTGTEFETDRIEPATRIIEVGTKESAVPTPTIPTVSDARPATPEEIKQLESLKEQLREEIRQSGLSQVEKDRFLNLVDQAVAKDQLTTQVNHRQVTVSLDNSQVQAARLVVRELQGAEAREVAMTVESQLDNQTVVTSYDIHLVDQNNQVVRNNGEKRSVTIAIAKGDDEILSVYYVNGEQLEEMPSIYQDGQLTFFTDHFSVYSIVRKAQTEQPTRLTPSKQEPTSITAQADVAGPELESPALPAAVQENRQAQATLPNTGEDQLQAGQLTAVGAGLLGLLGLAWMKRDKKDRV